MARCAWAELGSLPQGISGVITALTRLRLRFCSASYDDDTNWEEAQSEGFAVWGETAAAMPRLQSLTFTLPDRIKLVHPEEMAHLLKYLSRLTALKWLAVPALSSPANDCLCDALFAMPALQAVTFDTVRKTRARQHDDWSSSDDDAEPGRSSSWLRSILESAKRPKQLALVVAQEVKQQAMDYACEVAERLAWGEVWLAAAEAEAAASTAAL